MTDDNSNRRQATRRQADVPIELHHDHGFSMHSSRDISTGGAFFDRAIPYPVGVKLGVLLRLPGDQQPIRCRGEVVNVPDPRSLGMGVRFLDMASEDRARLATLTGEDPG